MTNWLLALNAADPHRSSLFTRPATPYQHAAYIGLILLLLVASTAVVYITGGTSYVYSYAMLIPVICCAAVYHTRGGLVAATAAALLMGPAMPFDAHQGIQQSTLNWLLRLGFYWALGGFTGLLFGRLAHTARQREEAMRIASCGLPNQAALMADLRSALYRSRQQGDPVALVLVQITDLTEVLSGVGAGSEDALLSAIAKNIQREIDRGPRVYHLGAAELVVLLEYEQDPDLDCVVDKITAIGEESVVIHNVPVRAQLVAGISRSPANGAEPQELIRQVRMAAFEAAEQQAPYCHYDTGFERDTAETMRLVGQIRSALAAGEFELFYQPKIRLADGTVQGCEALLRWRDASGETIAPNLFMPKVERTTLITPVTRFVSLEACDFLAKQSAAPVSVNFTAGNLLDPKLIDWLLQLVSDRKVPPQALEIEITEGALIKNQEGAIAAIKRLKAAGVGVLLDDFGTGYSSFGHLRHLPISGLKIDRAFVQDLDSDRRARNLMACMINVAHALGVEVTAEGVETAAQAELLRELGCDLAQGFFFARPMPANNYGSWRRTFENTAKPSRPGGFIHH